MIKSEQILSDLVLSNLPKDSMINALMSPHVNNNILLAMEVIAWKTWDYLTEDDGLSEDDLGHIDKRKDFEQWYNKQS